MFKFNPPIVTPEKHPTPPNTTTKPTNDPLPRPSYVIHPNPDVYNSDGVVVGRDT